MNPSAKPERSGSSPLVVFAALCLMAAVLHLAREVLIPLALAILLSFLLAPVVSRLERFRLSRVVAVVFTTLIAFGLLTGLGWILTDQVSDLAANTSTYKQNLIQKIRNVRGMSSPVVRELQRTAQELETELTVDPQSRGPRTVNTQGSAPSEPTTASPSSARPVVTQVAAEHSSPFTSLLDAIIPIISPFLDAGIVIVLVLFMLIQREDLRDRLIRLIGRQRMNETTKALDDAATRVSSYLGMQLTINLCYGVLVAAGLSIIGIPNALLWGMLGVLLRFLPYVGPGIVAGIPILLSLVIAPGWHLPLMTAGFFVLVEMLANNILEPLLYGKSAGISAFAVVVSALFWTWVWGLAGLVLATPLTVCILVVGKHIPQLAFLQILLGDEAALEPPVRFYQRLLASDQDEAREIAIAQFKAGSLLEVYDGLVLPALVLFQKDVSQNRLEPPTQESILREIGELIDEAAEWSATDETTKASSSDAPLATTNSSLEPLRSVVCIPARAEAEQLVGNMLAHVARPNGFDVEVLSAKVLSGELSDTLAQIQSETIVVSSLPPSELNQAYYICKRLAEGTRDQKLIVGLWGSTSDLSFAKPRIPLLASISTSVADALDELRRQPQPMAMRESA